MEKKLIWVDKSCFAKGDTERKPNAFECTLSPQMSMRVHRHIDYPGAWVLDARMVDIQRHRLNAEALDVAQAEAAEYTLEVLKAHRDHLDAAISALLCL